jgi:transcription elongation factor SPT5
VDDDAVDARGGTEVDQQARLPDAVKDAKLYLVKCKLGKERETAIFLMQKAKHLLETGGGTGDAAATLAAAKFPIKSAISQDHLKGYIYVEAARKPHVRQALKGLRNIYGSHEPQLVPIKEMQSSITVNNQGAAGISVGAWVRMRGGLYKGDLGRIIYMAADDNAAVVRLLPRFDYGEIKQNRFGGPLRTRKKKPAEGDDADALAAAAVSAPPHVKHQRPAARLFSRAEAEKAGCDVSQRRDKTKILGVYDLVQGQLRVKDGYLIRNVTLASIRAEPAPPFEELQRFAHAEAADAIALASAAGGGPAAGSAVTQLAALASSLGGVSTATGTVGATVLGSTTSLATSFAVGDTVIVVAPGDLKNLTGIVHAVDPAGGDIEVAPSDEQLAGTRLPFKPAELAKFFESGRHVRVTAGAHEGTTGMVVSTTEDVAVIITDVLREECKVFMRHLVDAADATSSDAMLGEYTLFDLALLADGVAGLVVQIERDGCIVLTHNGSPDRPEIRTLRLSDLSRKINPGRNTAQDREMSALSKGDAATVVDGPLTGTTGVIQWIHRGYLFLKSRDVQEHAGCFCVRSKNVRAAGSFGMGMTPGGASSSALHRAMAVGASPGRALQSPALHGMLPSAAAGARVLMSVPRSPRLDGAPGMPRGSAGLLLSGPRNTPGGGPASLLSPGAGVFSGRRSGGGGMRQTDPLVGQRILVRSGAYKGYRGIVLDATESVVRLELEANEKTVTLNRVHVDPSGQAALAPATVSASAAAAMAQTPSRDVFGRTPLHVLGNATPSRDPSATPGREGWAAFGATPARSAATPQRDAGLLAPFPMGGYGGMPSAQLMSGSMMHMSPDGSGSSFPPSVLVGGTPMSGSSIPMAPGQPMWVVPGLFVRVADGLTGQMQLAVARGVAPDLGVFVQITGSGVTASVPQAVLTPEPPSARGDKVIVIGQSDVKGSCGTIVIIDGADALVRFATGEPLLLPLGKLCRCE